MVLLMICIILAGAALPVQSAINVRLRQATGSVFKASCISFAIAFLVLVFLTLAAKPVLPSLHVIIESPWWVWIGGVIGAMKILAASLSIPKMGSVLTFALTLTGQLVLALLIDHFGFMSMPVIEISMSKIIGLIFVLSGVILVQRY